MVWALVKIIFVIDIQHSIFSIVKYVHEYRVIFLLIGLTIWSYQNFVDFQTPDLGVFKRNLISSLSIIYESHLISLNLTCYMTHHLWVMDPGLTLVFVVLTWAICFRFEFGVRRISNWFRVCSIDNRRHS